MSTALPLTLRLLRRARVYPVTGCLEWTGRLDREGYGTVWIKAGLPKPRLCAAHRVSYEVFVGPIPEGLQIDHLCRNRRCINPQHLEPVTGRVNTRRSPFTPASINAARTECVNGHAFDEVNTYVNPRTGWRNCRACKNERMRAVRQRSTP